MKKEEEEERREEEAGDDRLTSSAAVAFVAAAVTVAAFVFPALRSWVQKRRLLTKNERLNIRGYRINNPTFYLVILKKPRNPSHTSRSRFHLSPIHIGNTTSTSNPHSDGSKPLKTEAPTQAEALDDNTTTSSGREQGRQALTTQQGAAIGSGVGAVGVGPSATGDGRCWAEPAAEGHQNFTAAGRAETESLEQRDAGTPDGVECIAGTPTALSASPELQRRRAIINVAQRTVSAGWTRGWNHRAMGNEHIEFDRDDEFFATAGVSRRIKVFEFSTVVNEPSDVHCPVVEMSTRFKLSCLSWNKYIKNQIASSDYDGIVTVWDVNTRQSIMEYEEHEKRAWSVDFSRTEPSMLVSGSDDCKVGSADHHIHYYDLRNVSAPLHVFSGHRKAVSYVKFLSNDELASASTDSTLRLWDVKENFLVTAEGGADQPVSRIEVNKVSEQKERGRRSFHQTCGWGFYTRLLGAHFECKLFVRGSSKLHLHAHEIPYNLSQFAQPLDAQHQVGSRHG
ncbi:E3 ubiquitin-protein ligase [Nymphaea thermarum]|nr:E3 ubiquitin-protein ligase [Nymphaea thermarum]